MRAHVRLGRVAGVTVGIDWSVLFIFVLITFSLAAGRFPALFPGLDPIAYLIAGLGAGVVFFVSLLAHEVSHAVVARRHGVQVEGITLWLLGGVATIRGEPSDPSAELQIAGVGPLVSLTLAAAFWLIAAGLGSVGLPGIAVDVFIWLAVINLVLAIFNLMPAAPLDGGRILRAILWRRRGDRVSAAITASRAGRRFGWLLITLGLLEFLMGGFEGLWLMLIGWFLTTAAAAEEQQASISGALVDVRVRDAMSPDPVTVPANITTTAFLDDYVFDHRHSTFPLVDGQGRPVGLITLNRIKHVPAQQRDSTPVLEVACPMDNVPVAGPDDPLIDLVPRMTGSPDGRALVVQDDRLVGIVSPTDIIHRVEIARLARQPQTAASSADTSRDVEARPSPRGPGIASAVRRQTDAQ
jgi:Zn-dependent protease/CBS domain-containing protein